MKTKFLIIGNFLGKSTVGLTRMGVERLRQINRFAADFDIELLVPEDLAEYAREYDHMRVVKKGTNSSGWTTKVATKYARETKRTLINLTFPFALNRGSVVEIADMRYLEKMNGEYFDSLRFRLKMRARAMIGSAAASRITTISEFSKQRIHHFLKKPLDSIEVIPCGWEHMKQIVEDMAVFEKNERIRPGNYYFTLGSLARHKNHRYIAELAAKNPQATFVVAGGMDPQIFYQDCPHQNQDNLIFTGYLSDEAVKALMMRCKAFIFPSLYEGFGIPPLEALSCGVPVIVSDIEVLREIFGGCAHYINPHDPDVNLDELLAEKVDAPDEVLEKYTWEKAGAKWYEILKSFG